MNAYVLEDVATDENFNEAGYLQANSDVAQAVKSGEMPSGHVHFDVFGRHEKRKLRLPASVFAEAKRRKLAKIRPLLRQDLAYTEDNPYFDFLTEDMRAQFNIVDTDAVSSHNYDGYGMEIIESCSNGLVLDCGAGRRPIYYENVVNFEIVNYDTTDVRGVGEVLPFVDNAFDAVISVAVLEHVTDPFTCAREIARVLKPGGRLMCCVPFLQPFHGYPHHYYNMSYQGLIHLFNKYLEIDKVDVYSSVAPIWSLTWILKSWSEGLQGKTRDDFLNLKVSDLLLSGDNYSDRPFVTELSMEKNLELASANVLFAHKK